MVGHRFRCDEVHVSAIADVARLMSEDDSVLSGHEAPQVRHPDLDDEASPGTRWAAALTKHAT